MLREGYLYPLFATCGVATTQVLQQISTECQSVTSAGDGHREVGASAGGYGGKFVIVSLDWIE